MWLIRAALRRPITILVAVIAVALTSAFAVTRMRADIFPDLAAIDRDFSQMAANGFNTVRIPHTMPPRSLLDAAERHGLRVMVGLSAEQYVGYLIDRKGAPDIGPAAPWR